MKSTTLVPQQHSYQVVVGTRKSSNVRSSSSNRSSISVSSTKSSTISYIIALQNYKMYSNRQWYIVTLFIFTLSIGFLLEQQYLTSIKYDIIMEQQQQHNNLNILSFQEHRQQNIQSQRQRQQRKRQKPTSISSSSTTTVTVVSDNATVDNKNHHRHRRNSIIIPNTTDDRSNVPKATTTVNDTTVGLIESLQNIVHQLQNEQQHQQPPPPNIEEQVRNEIKQLLSNWYNTNIDNETLKVNSTGSLQHQYQQKQESNPNTSTNENTTTTIIQQDVLESTIANDGMYSQQKQNENHNQQQQPKQQQQQDYDADRTTVHILYGLSGNETGFLHELEISLKSVLLNAPYHAPMVIHIMADQIAYDSLSDTMLFTNRTHYLSTWRTNQPITIRTYNIESYIPKWSTFIQTATNYSIVEQTEDHTIGTYFRLFAHHVILPRTKTTKFVLYLDTDVVIMANLDHVWSYTIPTSSTNRKQQQQQQSTSTKMKLRSLSKQIKDEKTRDSNVNASGTTTTISTNNNNNNNNTHPKLADEDPYFLWGLSECAGFIILNLEKLDTIWELVSGMDLNELAEIENDWISDQFVLRMINKTYPEFVGVLPDMWDVSVAAKSKLWRGDLVSKRPNGVGMLHFNGGKNSTASAYNTSNFILYDKFRHSWGNANYYVNLPWNWVQFIIESRINPYSSTGSNNDDAKDATTGSSSTKGTNVERLSMMGYPIRIFHKPTTMENL